MADSPYDHAVAHMNADHQDALVAIVGHLTGITPTHAQITEMDDDGFTCEVEGAGDGTTAWVPFPGAPISPEQVRDVMVAMTRDARG